MTTVELSDGFQNGSVTTCTDLARWWIVGDVSGYWRCGIRSGKQNNLLGPLIKPEKVKL